MKKGTLAITDRIPVFLRALFKKETPFVVKGLMALTLAYAIMPLDILPDFLGFLGLVDDAIVLPLMASLAWSLMPDAVIAETSDEMNRDRKSAEKIEI